MSELCYGMVVLVSSLRAISYGGDFRVQVLGDGEMVSQLILVQFF